MAGKQKSAVPNWKKKKWYEILAPSAFAEKSLGESLCGSPESLVNKVITVNLMNLTDNPRKQNFSMKLKVVQVKDKKGITKPFSLTMLPSSIKRLIKTGRDRLDMSFVVSSKEGVSLRVKPLLVTKENVSRSKKTDVQEKVKDFFIKYAEKNDFETVFSESARGEIQKTLKKELTKICAMRLVEIRAVEVELVKGERSLGEIQMDKPVEPEKVEKSESEVESEVESAEDVGEETVEEVDSAEEVEETKAEDSEETLDEDSKDSEETEKKSKKAE